MTLWWKAWLELRWRFLTPLAAAPLLFFWPVPTELLPAPDLLARLKAGPGGFGALLNTLSLFVWPLLAVLYAGAGINTQTAYSPGQAVHPSMLFTLALPVTRRRLLLMRAAAGVLAFSTVVAWLCAVAWIALPDLRAWLTAGELSLYVVSTVLASMVFYWFAVMLAAFLDEFWVAHGTLMLLVAMIQVRLSIPGFAPFDVFRAMGDLSYAATGCMPWGRLAACAILSSAFVAATIRIVERREY